MALPQRSPYDEPSQDAAPYKPHLTSLEGGGQSTPGRGNLRSVPTPAQEDAAANATAGGSNLSVLQGGGQKTPGRGNLQAVPPDGLKDAEQKGLYNPKEKGDYDRAPLKQRIKNISARRKAFAAVGVGGVAGLVLSVLTIAPMYRVPSVMNGVMGFVGEQVEDVVEKRAQRMIIAYLIQRAGGNPDNYVITGSPLETLWATFRVNRLEEKIYKQTGLRIVQEDGGLYLRLDGDQESFRTQIKNADDVLALIDTDLSTLDPKKKGELQKAMRTIIRSTVPALRFNYSSEMANYMRIKYGLRFSAPEYDKAKTEAENVKNLRTSQIDNVTKQNISLWSSVFSCILEDQCDRFKTAGQPADTTPRPPESEATRDSASKFTRAASEAASEAGAEVAKTGEEFTKSFTSKLISKIIGATGAAAASAGIIEMIDLISVLNHVANEARDNPALYNLPATLASQSSGAFFSQWQGFSSQIMAGKMPLSYISALNKQIEGAEEAMGYDMTYKGTMTGVPPDFRVDTNAQFPSQTMMRYYSYTPGYIVTNALLELWFNTVHQLIEKVGDWAFGILSFIIGHPIEAALKSIFGENWKEEAATWAIGALTDFLGASIDPLAKGARWMNQIVAGGQSTLNSYCEAELGCKALTPLVEQGFFESPFFYNGGSTMFVSEDDRKDMALLPLQERLLSIEEPNSLLNETIRALPESNNPVAWFAGSLRQAASVPSNVVGVFSARASAATTKKLTLEQQASFAGVRIYGGTAEGFAKDISVEVRQQKTSYSAVECPPNNSETTFNVCQADKKIVSGLMCVYDAECQAYQQVSGLPTEAGQGFKHNIQRLWDIRQAASFLSW